MSNYSDQIRNAGLMETLHDDWRHQQEREQAKRQELLSKFMNGLQRHHQESIFRNIIEAMVRGADPLDIIEKLIDMNKEISDKFKNLIIQWPSHIPPKLD